METHQLSAASRNIAVSAEISVHLPRKRVCSDQNDPEVWLSELASKRGVRQQGAIVCDHTLSYKAGENQHQTIEKSVCIEGAILVNLRKQVARSLNRPGDQVREKADE
jgi:hypothetical protein